MENVASGIGVGGSSGRWDGTEMGEAGRESDRLRRCVCNPYCFFVALKRAIALSSRTVNEKVRKTQRYILFRVES